jgi:hypothetical protein
MAMSGLVMAAMGTVTTMRMVGPAHRLERLDDISDLGAETDQHLADDVIALDQDAAGFDLSSEMPVAEMPSELDQVLAVTWTDLEQPLLGRMDLDRRAIIEHKPVAVVEKNRLLEVEHDHIAIVEMQELASQMTPVMGKHNGAFRRIGDRTGRFEGCRALHENSRHDCFLNHAQE